MRESKPRTTHSRSVSDTRPAPAGRTRKVYHAPVLEEYGDLDDLTLANGNGSGDGAGGAMSKNPCWIAEVLYGVDDHRTHLLRAWLTGVYARTAVGAPVVALYRVCGERVAGWARRSAVLRRLLTPLFDGGVAAALRHYTLAAR